MGTKIIIKLAITILIIVITITGCKNKQYTELPDFLAVYPYNDATLTEQEKLDGILVEVNNWDINLKENDGDYLLMQSTLSVNGKIVPNETARWVQFGMVNFSLIWDMPLPEGNYEVTYQLVDDDGFSHEYSWSFDIVKKQARHQIQK